MLAEVQELIRGLKLKKHPEGGYYRETYRAPGSIPKDALPKGFGGNRNYSTAVYYLLSEGQRSRFHALKSDEIWHFYLGGPLELIQLSPAGDCRRVVLGRNLAGEEMPQHAVPAGHWFAAAPLAGSLYSLLGCTVAPGFDFSDFSLADPAELTARFPRHAEIIKRFSA